MPETLTCPSCDVTMTQEEFDRHDCERDFHMRAFLAQGLEATKGIGSGSLPRIEYSANADGSVSEKTTWVTPQKESNNDLFQSTNDA